MIRLGEFQDLEIIKLMPFGAYLAENKAVPKEQQILLPSKEVPEDAGEGDILNVLVYRDSDDRYIATLRTPLITLGKTARLKVKEVTRIGAFLDWGLEKDLLLPYHEQTRKVKEGEEILAALYTDKSDRLAATMNVYHYLRNDPPYKRGDIVSGTVYETSDNFGVFVAVDDIYSGLVPIGEAAGTFRIGDTLNFRVTRVKKDGKLDLSARKKAYKQMDSDAKAIFDIISGKYNGNLPFDDKADPDVIREVFGLSKAAFKRGVGRLYKERKISLENGEIRIL